MTWPKTKNETTRARVALHAQKFQSTDQSGPEARGDGVSAIAGAKLPEQAAGMGFDRVLRDEKLPADLCVTSTVGHAP